ncbi:MAG: signal recognition particle subunit SRP19/SEC65 family protein [Nitrososphaerota archaeon]|nr:signal recognition particle subunit SRP19/SEC65 family protein [Candidatus Geocrenenecus dongiae]
MIKKDGYIVWPIYFDKNVPRSRCRKVPLSLAVKNPTVEKIAEVARRLGWRVEIESASHPSTWWIKSGKLIIKPDKPMNKNTLIKILGKALSTYDKSLLR